MKSLILVALLSVSAVQANSISAPEWDLVTRKLTANECAVFAEKRCLNVFHLKMGTNEFKECKELKTNECNERQKKKED